MSRKTTKQTDKQAGTRNAQEPGGAQPIRPVTLRDAYEAMDQAMDMLARCGDKDDTPGGIRSLDEVQRAYTLAVLACCNGHRTRAAVRLRIGRATLYRRLDKYQDDEHEVDAILRPVARSTAARLAHLPKGTRQVINRLVDLITIIVDVEAIVLFGRYARPGGVDDGNQGDDSTLDLLVLVEHPDLALRSDVWDVLEERAQWLARPTRVRIERRTVANVAAEIVMGDKDLGGALENGVPLYDVGRVSMQLWGGSFAR